MFYVLCIMYYVICNMYYVYVYIYIYAYFNRLCFGYDSLPLAHAVHTLLFLELVGSWRLVEWLRGWLVGRLVGLLSGWLVDWMVW